MGRLFWKFFIFVWVSQLIVMSCIGLSLWMQDRIDDLNLTPETDCFIDSAISTLQNGGINELKNTLIKSPYPLLYVIDENKNEIFNRKIPDKLLQQISILGPDKNIKSVQEAIGPDKHIYTFFMPIMNKLGEFVFRQEPIFPLTSFLVTILVSLIIATFLAWYFYKPISYLRSGFNSVANGNLKLRLQSVIGNRRDELSDLSRDFDYMTKQLLNLMNSKRNLLHAVSHELRSPLARIQLAIGLSRQQPEKTGILMDRVEYEAIRLNKLIDEFMSLSYLETESDHLNKEKINFCKILNDIVLDAKFETDAQNKHIQYTECLPVTIDANAEYLHRAIENIVRNAIKFTLEQGTIYIEVKSNMQGITLYVLDEGPGIPQENLNAIFEPFFRGNVKNDSGYGLGLTIAKRVIELHHGTIKVYNRDGHLKGVCVEVYLPIENHSN